MLVDRTTDFGNRFVVGVHGSRGECVQLHLDWIMAPEQAEFRARVRAELCGRDLVCWCVSGAGPAPPLICHAQTLLVVANPSM